VRNTKTKTKKVKANGKSKAKAPAIDIQKATQILDEDVGATAEEIKEIVEKNQQRNGEVKKISMPAFSGIRQKYTRMPTHSPIQRLSFGRKLGVQIQNQLLKEERIINKIATGASLTAEDQIDPIRVGQSSIKKLTEAQLMQKFGTDNIVQTFENIYDHVDYTRFHDAVRSDGMTRGVILKKSQYTMGETTDLEFVPREKSSKSLDEDMTNDILAEKRKQEEDALIPGPELPDPEKDDKPPQFTKEEVKARLQAEINQNELLMSLKDELKRIDEDCDLYLNLHGFLFQFDTYGAGLAGIERDEMGVPITIKILTTMMMGRHFRSIKDWKLVGIEYLDYQAKDMKNILLADDVLYLANLPYNLAPNSYGYGLSQVETLVDVAEQNIILNQMDLKEGNRSSWTPSFVLFVKNAEGPADVTTLRQSVEDSRVTVTELDAEPRIIDNTTNVTQLTEERQLNDEAIARYSDTPALIAGLERIQVKAAGGQVLFAWTQSTLLKIREVLRVYLQRAWYLRNLKAIILRRLKRLGFAKIDTETGKPIIDKTALASQLEESRTGEDRSTRIEDQSTPSEGEAPPTGNDELGSEKKSENGLPIDENGAEIIPDISQFQKITDFIPFLDHLDKLPFYLKMTYKTITIDGLLEKTASVVSLHAENIIDNRYSWKILDFADLLANPPAHLLMDEKMIGGVPAMTALTMQEKAASAFGGQNEDQPGEKKPGAKSPGSGNVKDTPANVGMLGVSAKKIINRGSTRKSAKLESNTG
jgi:hypothetical protein